MSVAQNEKIRQVTETTMVIGVDIARDTHWARAFDWRGLELSKAVKFENSAEGFHYFLCWASELAAEQKKGRIMVGLEPTGHYWFTLAAYLQGGSMKLVLVNPYHVKCSKELDDGHPSKSDKKDPKTIAKLVLEGRYVLPYIPQGLYAELRVAMNCRWRVQKELTSVQNQIQRWLKIYFPEHKTVFGEFEGIGSMALLHAAPLPSNLVALGVDGINQIWRQMKLRCAGLKRAQRAFEAAQNSVGYTTGIEAARWSCKFCWRTMTLNFSSMSVS